MRPCHLVGIASLATIWGGNFLFTEMALRGLAPVQIVLLRLFVSGLILLVAARLMNATLPTSPAVLGRLLVMGMVGQAVPWLLFTLGSRGRQFLSGRCVYRSHAAADDPGYLRHAAYPEQSRRVVASCLGFVELVVVLSPWDAGNGGGSLRGQFLCLFGALSYAIAFGYVGRILRDLDLPKISLAATLGLLAGVLMLPLAGGDTVRVPDLNVTVVSGAAVLAIASAAAFVINYWLIEQVGPVRASLAFYLIPLVAVLLGTVVLHERLSGNEAIGGGLIMASLVLLFWWEREVELASLKSALVTSHSLEMMSESRGR